MSETTESTASAKRGVLMSRVFIFLLLGLAVFFYIKAVSPPGSYVGSYAVSEVDSNTVPTTTSNATSRSDAKTIAAVEEAATELASLNTPSPNNATLTPPSKPSATEDKTVVSVSDKSTAPATPAPVAEPVVSYAAAETNKAAPLPLKPVSPQQIRYIQQVFAPELN